MSSGLNRGKQFEQKFRQDWTKSFPDSFIIRLQDSQSGYYGTSSNPCDFIGFVSGKLFLIECKSIHGNTLPFSNLTQLDKITTYLNKKDIYPGFLVWWEDWDKVAWVPAQSILKMKEDSKKSIHIKMVSDKLYDIIEIPSIKKRVFLDSDYSVLLKIGDK